MSHHTTTTKKLPVGESRNRCPSCWAHFSSPTAFDKHRVGAFRTVQQVKAGVPVQRRCRTPEEMESIGMVLGDDGYWRSSAATRNFVEHARRKLPDLPNRTRPDPRFPWA